MAPPNEISQLIDIYYEIITGPDNKRTYLRSLLSQDFFAGVDIGRTWNNGSPILGSFSIRLLHQDRFLANGPEQRAFFQDLMEMEEEIPEETSSWEIFLEYIKANIEKEHPRILEVAITDNPNASTLKVKPNQLGSAFPNAPINRIRPDLIQPGISISHESNQAGTLGAILYGGTVGSPIPYLLSAYHVMAHAEADQGHFINRPGTGDGRPQQRKPVAQLDYLRHPKNGEVWVDGILGRLLPERDNPHFPHGGHKPHQLGTWNRNEAGGGEIHLKETLLVNSDHLTLNHSSRLIFSKSGKSSGITSGILDGVGAYRMPFENHQAFAYLGFTLVPDPDIPSREELSRPGDSGALWFVNQGGTYKATGLHMDGERAGDPNKERAFACHFEDILAVYQSDDLTLALTIEDLPQASDSDLPDIIGTGPKVPGVQQEVTIQGQCPRCGEPIQLRGRSKNPIVPGFSTVNDQRL